MISSLAMASSASETVHSPTQSSIMLSSSSSVASLSSEIKRARSDMTQQTDERIVKRLARNREAARRYKLNATNLRNRIRKKKWHDDLQRNTSHNEALNTQLKLKILELEHELGALRNKLSKHGYNSYLDNL